MVRPFRTFESVSNKIVDRARRVSSYVRTGCAVKAELEMRGPGRARSRLGGRRVVQRWRLSAVRPCTAWIATERGAQAYGGVRRGDLKLATQVTHDLGVSAQARSALADR